VKQIDGLLANFGFANKLEQQTGVPKAYLLLGVLGFMVLIVLWQSGWNAVCSAVGFFYPMYASFKALKSQDADDDTEWLTYWVVHGAFIFAEDFCDFIVPASLEGSGFLWYMLKICFLLWLMLPQTRGAEKVFKYVVSPLVSRYEPEIDKELESFVKQANVTIAEGQKHVVNTAVQSMLHSSSAPRSRKND